MYVGRFTDQGSWIRRSTKESVLNSGRESPALRPGQYSVNCRKFLWYSPDPSVSEPGSRPDDKIEPNQALETPKLGSIEVVGHVR